MKLSESLSADHIVLDFEAKKKDDAIGALVDPVVNGFDRDTVLAEILEREELGSTGVGQGVAVPHVRLAAIQEPSVVFGRAAKPVDFDAIDDEPCSLFFLVLGPTSADAQDGYLKTMAKISRLMRSAETRSKLMAAASESEVIDIIAANEA
ncbi:MAG: PTS sugar transporter subunit IIA [Verrucomicrobia bacterium]|nr:PTS sugar transporter subunit IIA [Verrucomicrobiota bacterium]MBT7065783.1 PTS sugar transporter subunit IIA [Verrucomicrobiota bacterium]MBT7701419.1 PTS sugar transporter subunit IIA [Verrucomicrobiota bacterium]